jgi:glutamyl-tRNA synthetase
MPADDEVAALVPLVQERLPLLGAIGDQVGFLFVDRLEIDPALLIPKRWGRQTTLEALRAARRVVAEAGEVSYEADELEPALRAVAEERDWKAGDLFKAIRVAITGRTATPPLFDTMVALGRDRTLERLDRAVDVLSTVESSGR